MVSDNNKFDFVSYTIYTPKIMPDEEKRVILIADLHDYLKYKKKAQELAEAIKKCNPHHIIIAGDIMQGKKWKNVNKLSDFSNFLDQISEVAPVFISQGNHDLLGINSKNKGIMDKNFKDLEKIKPGRIFPLINDVITYDNFVILGYTPDVKILGALDIQKHGIAHDMFIKEYMENGVSLTKDNKHIIEFVGHNPHLIARSENGIGLENLKYVDTFYTGHLHNGYRRSTTIKRNPDKYLDFGYVEMPYYRDKNGKTIAKSFSSLFYRKISLCRGTVYINDSSQRKILQLRNNSFYINSCKKDNEELWKKITEKEARKKIRDNRYHPLVITGGIRKFFGFSIPKDNPEITEIIYKGQNI